MKLLLLESGYAIPALRKEMDKEISDLEILLKKKVDENFITDSYR